ncbi:hypothetical protein HDU85_004488 [Gaertneriomyces sp. JEL0708]|nr:hypothetical protein HDU85_004488 [Gaertneriomyces sp. JEL0708]
MTGTGSTISLHDDGKKPKAAKPSRKGKKAWRKNVDVTDVEEGVQEIRNELREGGARITDQQNDDLFTVDTKGGAPKRNTLKYKTLTIDKVLTLNSSIESVRSRQSASSVKLVKDLTKKPKKVSKSTAVQVEKLAKKLSTAPPQPQKKAAQKEQKAYDVWSEAAETEDPNDYLAPAKPVAPKKPKLPEPVLKSAPAVEVVAPGASYNPSFEAHQAALREAVDAEVKKEEEKEGTRLKLTYPPELDAIDDETFFPSDDEEEESDAEPTNEVDEDGLAHTASVTADRKTRAQRNREQRLAEQKREEMARVEQKKLEKQINRLGEIKKIISKEEREKEQKAAERAQKLAEKAKADPGRLGPHHFKPLPTDVSLTETLPDSLRELAPEGNLFRERFVSLQKRALVEARVPVGKRLKFRRKEVETHDYKRFK